LLHIVGVHEST